MGQGEPRDAEIATVRARGPVRDDRILPFTRIVAVIVAVILAAAWFALYLHPGETDTRFAWTIQSRMTAMLMGAAYGSAIVFFAAVLFGRRWHRVGLGLIPTTVFTWVMLAVTVIHWDKFRHGSFPFELWLWVYLTTPVLVPAVWLVNHRHDPRTPDAGESVIGRPVRMLLIGLGVVLVALAAVLFFWPSGAISAWPWPLTPLTSRVLAGFVALPGVAWLALAADRRWSSGRAAVITVVLGSLLILGAVARAWSEFDHSNALTYVYVAGLVATVIGLAALWVYEERPARNVRHA